MNHITKEKSVDIAREHLWRYKPSGHPKQSDAYLFNDECMQALCNAAIEWHIAQQAASVDATFKKWNAEKAASEWYAIKYDASAQQTPVAGTSMEDMRRAGYQEAPKEPLSTTIGNLINLANIIASDKPAVVVKKLCAAADATEHHSCLFGMPDDFQAAIADKQKARAAIEHYIAQQAAREPVAYFDFQEHGFYWAPNVKIGDVPVIRKVAPMPLYSEPDMYKSESKTNTSQERVQKSEEFKQMLEAAYLAGFNESGEGYNAEYGANVEHPMWIKDRDTAIAAITTGGKK